MKRDNTQHFYLLYIQIASDLLHHYCELMKMNKKNYESIRFFTNDKQMVRTLGLHTIRQII